jgi:prepilin-type N-terminal cleavage/methylation domain-containing protein
VVALNGTRGQSLIEVLIAIAILLAALAGAVSISQSHAPAIAATSALPAIVGEARSLAATSGDGATVVLAPEGSGTNPAYFRVMLFIGRPRPGGSFDGATPVRSERLVGRLSSSAAGAGSVAIFISTAGSASYAAWSPGQAPLASEPACIDPLVVSAAGARFSVACADAQLMTQA